MTIEVFDVEELEIMASVFTMETVLHAWCSIPTAVADRRSSLVTKASAKLLAHLFSSFSSASIIFGWSFCFLHLTLQFLVELRFRSP